MKILYYYNLKIHIKYIRKNNFIFFIKNKIIFSNFFFYKNLFFIKIYKKNLFIYFLNFFFFYFLENFFNFKIFFKINFKNLLFNYNSIFYFFIKSVNFSKKKWNIEFINIFIWLFFYKDLNFFKNWFLKKFREESFKFLNFFFSFFNKKYYNFYNFILKLFSNIGFFIIIKGKFLKQNSLKKKKKFYIGNLNFSSKNTKLLYNSFQLNTINGIFNIKIFLSFI